MSETTPRIYVACLASYNNSILHGAWIDCDKDVEDIEKEIKEKVLKTSLTPNAEEWAIHDYENWGGLKISEYTSLDNLSKLCALMEEHGELIAKFIDYNCSMDDLDEVEEKFQEQYLGCFRSLGEWAEEFLNDTGALSDMPENLRYYFDYDKCARDCEMGGDVYTIETHYNEVHVFSNT